MNSDIKNRIRSLVLSSLEIEVNSELAKTFNKVEELGIAMNSIVVLEIVMNLEQEFDISLENFSVAQVQDIDAMEDLVLRSLQPVND